MGTNSRAKHKEKLFFCAPPLFCRAHPVWGALHTPECAQTWAVLAHCWFVKKWPKNVVFSNVSFMTILALKWGTALSLAHYFTEFGKPVFRHVSASICGRIYARVYCILHCMYDVVFGKFTFAISSPDKLSCSLWIYERLYYRPIMF